MVGRLQINEQIEKKRSRIRVVQMNKLGSLLGIRKVDEIPDSLAGQFYGVKKGKMERLISLFPGGFFSYGNNEKEKCDLFSAQGLTGESGEWRGGTGV